jgi:integrase
MSQRSLRLTEKDLASAQVDAIISNKPIFLWCSQLRGFGLRISPPSNKYRTGKTSYIVQKRVAGRHSREIRFTFGEYPAISLIDAYNLALKHISHIRSNINPAQNKKSLFAQRRQEYQNYKTQKFAIIFENYRKKRLEENGANTNYFEKEMPQLFNKYVIPLVGNKSFTEIQKDDIKTLLRTIEKVPTRGKVEAMLKPLFKYALTEDIIKTNPFDGIQPTPKPKSRDRYLSAVELHAYWSAATDIIETEKPLFGHFYKLLLLSAARLREIAELEISELQLDKRQIHIAPSRMKNDNGHIIPLSDFTIAQINNIPRKHKTFVFSYGRSHLQGFSAAKSLLDDAMKPYLQRQNQESKPWVNHSLRHTFATHMAEQGANTDIIDRCLSHISKQQEGVRGVYQLYEFMPERRAVMQQWSDFVEKLGA